MAADAEKSETPIVEKHGTNNRLAEVVGKAHLTVWGNLQEAVVGPGTIEEKHY